MTMTSAMYLLLPLSPATVGGAAYSWQWVIQIWVIQFLLEAVAPEMLISILSQRVTSFGDVTGALGSIGSKQILIIAFISISSITYMHGNFLQNLCVSPRDADGGGGLLSFGACCPRPDDWDGMSIYCCCLLYTSPSPRDRTRSRMPSSA